MSSKYLLPCDCGVKHAVDIAHAGTTVTCECGADLEVPSVRGIRELERVQETRDASSAQKENWDKRRAWIFVGMAIAVGSLLLFAWHAYRRPVIVEIKDLSPEETWVAWQEFRQGLNRRMSDSEAQHIAALKQHRLESIGILVLCGLGILITGIAFVFRRNPIGNRHTKGTEHSQTGH